MTLSRRRFVLTSVAGVLAARAPLVAPASKLRIGILTEQNALELRRGIDFGVAEARHSARLVGWEIETVPLAEARVDATTVDAIILARSQTPAAARFPMLRLTPWRGALAPNELAVHPGEDTMARALARHADSASVAAERRVVVWHETLERFGAGQLNDRMRGSLGTATSEAWLGWFAVKCLWESAARARVTNPDALLSHMRHHRTRYDGHKGMPLRFNERGELEQPLYVVERTQAERVDGERWKVIAEVVP